jgi:hypothetical protein
MSSHLEQFKNPGEIYYYDWRSDPRDICSEDMNTPDHRGVHYRIRILEETKGDAD